MPRARNIKPQIMANEDLAEISAIGRLLFVYLWMLADREGRLEDRPKRIKAQALPYDDADADALLCDLQDAGFITRYTVGDKAVIQIVSFSKHQNPHSREQESELPGPDHAEAKHNLGSDNAQPRQCRAGLIPDSLIPDSLIPDSLNPDSLQNTSSAAPTESTPKRVPLDDGFAEFWDAYPKKVEKKAALDAWKAKKLNGHAQEVIDHVRRRATQDRAWLDGYIPSPKRFLRDERWHDQFAPNLSHREKVLQSIEQRTNPVIEGRLTNG
jgi:hypothetical protein